MGWRQAAMIIAAILFVVLVNTLPLLWVEEGQERKDDPATLIPF